MSDKQGSTLWRNLTLGIVCPVAVWMITAWLRPSAEVTFSGEVGKFVEPPDTAEDETRLHDYVIRTAMLFSELEDSARIARYVKTQPFRIWSEGYESLLTGTLTNRGERPAKEVIISYPSARLARVIRPGVDTILSPANVIVIGTLLPKESVTLTIWARHSYVLSSISEVTVSHSEGTGDVRIGEVVRSGLPLRTARFLTLFIDAPIGLQASMLSLCLLGVVGVALLIDQVQGARKTRKHSSSEDRTQ